MDIHLISSFLKTISYILSVLCFGSGWYRWKGKFGFCYSMLVKVEVLKYWVWKYVGFLRLSFHYFFLILLHCSPRTVLFVFSLFRYQVFGICETLWLLCDEIYTCSTDYLKKPHLCLTYTAIKLFKSTSFLSIFCFVDLLVYERYWNFSVDLSNLFYVFQAYLHVLINS